MKVRAVVEFDIYLPRFTEYMHDTEKAYELIRLSEMTFDERSYTL